MSSNYDSELLERFKALRKVLGKTQKEIGEAIGGSLRTWQNYEIGRSSPSWRVLHALIDMGVNVNWLLTGRGEMFFESLSASQQKVAEARPSYGADPDQQAAEQWTTLPLIESAGAPVRKAPLAFCSSFLHGLADCVSALALYQIPDNTQSRFIDDGRFIIVDTARTCLSAGGYYLLHIGDALSLMHVQRDHKHNVYLQSGNQHYREITVDARDVDDLEVLGRAVWADRLL